MLLIPAFQYILLGSNSRYRSRSSHCWWMYRFVAVYYAFIVQEFQSID